MIIFKGEKGYERAAGAKFFWVYGHFKGENRYERAAGANFFLRYTTIFKGEIGYECAAGAKILGTPDFSNLRSQFLPKSQFPPTFLKSQLPPPLRGGGVIKIISPVLTEQPKIMIWNSPKMMKFQCKIDNVTRR